MDDLQQDNIQQEQIDAPERPPLAIAKEPKLHSVEWFDVVLSNNEAVAAQKLSEYHQVLGAINILKAQRDAVIAETTKG
jgi:hypothetical protein